MPRGEKSSPSPVAGVCHAPARAGVQASALILANPVSGGYRADVLERLSGSLRENGYDVDTRLTRKAGEITEFCSADAPTDSLLVVAGGDGSVNEVFAGFQSRETTAPVVAIVPFGTANVLAHELGLPRTPEAIADMILRNKTKNLYTGLANGKLFVLMVSAGFDAGVVHGVSHALKRRVGKMAYVIAAFRAAFRSRWGVLEVDDGHAVHRCRIAVVTNASHYGGPFVLCPDASATEPGLHVVMFESDDPVSLLTIGARLLTGGVCNLENARVIRVDRAKITCSGPAPVQVDGDPFGSTPLSIECGPCSFSVLVP
ncbi:diacylglycerol/lipid kinase family protein [Pseudomonadota bacterium]